MATQAQMRQGHDAVGLDRRSRVATWGYWTSVAATVGLLVFLGWVA